MRIAVTTWCSSLALMAGLTAVPGGISAQTIAPQTMNSPVLTQAASPISVQTAPGQVGAGDSETAQNAYSRFAEFAPTTEPIRHRIDYELWDFALKNLVLSMGPSIRQTARRPDPVAGTRIRQGPDSRYRLEGSLVLFSFLEQDTIASFTEYRQDLERVSNTLDLATLPRNEQLAFWLNLHNVALLERLAVEWPVRQPRDIEVDGVLLDDAKILTISGVPLSLRDIRENIVFANWRDPKVIYGFWRGEIGGPALEREAYTGANVSSLLDAAAEDFINSLRGTQKRGDRLQVSTLYEEARPFYFADFESELRPHLTYYANEDVADLIDDTDTIQASIRDWDIADIAGGARPANYLNSGTVGGGPWSIRVPQFMYELLTARQRKLDTMQRREVPTGRVIFSTIDLPGDPPNKNAVE